MVLDMNFGLEDADGGGKPHAVGFPPGAGTLAVGNDVGKVDELKAVGAGQYDFFATGGPDLGGLEDDLGGLEGGLEDGVEAPPEEEEVEAGLSGLGEDDGLDQLIDKDAGAPSTLQHTPAASALAAADTRAPPNPPQGVRRWSVDSAPTSFLSDPIAGPPPRVAGHTSHGSSMWQSAAGTPPPDSGLRSGGLAQSYGPFSGPPSQEVPRSLEPWGGSLGLGQGRTGLVSGQQRPGEWQPPPPPPQAQQPGQPQMYLQRPSRMSQSGAAPRAMTVEELEARMMATQRARQQAPAAQALPQSLVEPPQFPSLARQSAGSYTRSPAHSRTPSYSLPTGIPGVQQGLAAVSLGQAAAAAMTQQGVTHQAPPSPGALQHWQALSQHSPSLAAQPYGQGPAGRPGSIYGSPQPGSDALMQQRQPMQGGGRGFGAQFAPQPGFGRRLGEPMGTPELRRRGSKYMEAEEIEAILRIQWKSLHNGVPYTDDYYFQAFVNKHLGGGNRQLFVPESLRDLAPSEKLGAEPAMYVKLEGLGKIAYSNVRRPRPLMDLVADSPALAAEDAPAAGEEERRGAKPLEEEPLLAARIVIEDCMCLLLDVDDIDRVWAATGPGREDEHLLRQRRSLLMDAFASSLRLPDGALPPPPGATRTSDAVFVHLMRLHKGRALLARALRLLGGELASATGYAGPAGRRPPPLRILWASLRNVRLLFGIPGPSSLPPEREAERAAARRLLDATTRLAAAAAKAMRSLESPRAVCDCMAALVHGDLAAKAATSASNAEDLLPLVPMGEPMESETVWLADVVAALLNRAQALGLAAWASQQSRSVEGLAVPEGIAWRDCFAAFNDLLVRHLSTLAEVCRVATEAGAMDAATYAKQIVPVALIKACLPHMTDGGRERIRDILSQLR